MKLEHIFDLEVQATSADHVAPFGGQEGYLSAAGEGKVAGPEVNGTLSRFTFFERNREDGSCEHTLDGVIETDDGAKIFLDVDGVLRRDEAAGPDVWNLVSSVRFIAQDERYGWLNGALGVWEGTVDTATGQGTYKVYRAINELGSATPPEAAEAVAAN